MNRGLGRFQEFDERSRAFRAVAGIEEAPLRRYTWSCKTWNDQGYEGACVGFGWGHELAARPAPFPTDYDYSMGLYHRAQQLDQWLGEDYEGTSVLAGAKAVREKTTPTGRPLIEGYSWAFGTEEILRTLAWKGPVVFGCDWYEGMWDTDTNGFIHPTGPVVGGHCVCLNRAYPVRINPLGDYVWSNLDKDKSFVQGRNSWGYAWGVEGNFKINLTEFETLVRGADACIPFGRHYV